MQFDHVIPGRPIRHRRAMRASGAFAGWRGASPKCSAWTQTQPFEDSTRGEFPLNTSRDQPRLPLPASRLPRQAPLSHRAGRIHSGLRREAARAIADMHDWPGFGIGGLSVGEEKPAIYEMIEVGTRRSEDPSPLSHGRWLPEDLIEAIRRGIDMFDCVAPTRMGRNGAVFTRDGRLNIKRAEFRTDPSRSTATAIAPPARDSAEPTSGTSSSRTRYSGCASSPCTMYISFCRSPGRRGRR